MSIRADRRTDFRMVVNSGAQCQLKEWDVSRATLSKIEAGLRRVTDAEVYLLAKILGVPVADLFPGEAEVMKAIRNP